MDGAGPFKEAQMKATITKPFYDRNGLHKKGDIVEITTAAFNPSFMAETPEDKKIIELTVDAPKMAEYAAKKPVRKSRKKKE